jgi:hypothetical protein
MSEEIYSNIRELLGWGVGKTVADITQHDKQEFQEQKEAFVMIMFEDGSYIKFYSEELGFSFDDGLPE